MSTTEEWTIGRLLTWTADYLKKQGASSPRLDAEVLLAFARGCQRIDLYTAFGDRADEALREKFRALVKRRAEGTPVAYLVGHREFYSLSFHVTPAVLIPRPETEFVVIAVLDRIKQLSAAGSSSSSPILIADVGTGSGAIAISLARHVPAAQCVALDISPAALEVAQRNATELQVAPRITFLESDLLAALPDEPTLDFVVSNPPYVSESEWQSLARDVRDYEPRQALVGGETGAEIIARLVPQAASRLRPGGLLVMEISPMIESRVVELLAADSRFRPAVVTKDLAGLPRVVQAQRTDDASSSG